MEFANEPTNFLTSDLPPDEKLTLETAKILDELLLSLKLERAVIFVKTNGAWRVASAHEVETNDFWNTAPLSLSVVQSAALEGKSVHLVDAGSSDKFGDRMSVLLTGIRSVACAPCKSETGEVIALLYADNRIEKGAFSPEDIKAIEGLAQELGRRISALQ